MYLQTHIHTYVICRTLDLRDFTSIHHTPVLVESIKLGISLDGYHKELEESR